MKITWVTFGAVQQIGHQLYSPLASTRYRVILPSLALSKKGHVINLLSIHDQSNLDEIYPRLNTDILVFSKSTTPKNERLLKYAQQKGIKVFFDVCDNHFENPTYATHYKTMSRLSDQITVNTPQMAEIMMQYTGRQAVVIGDPYEGPQGQPRFAPTSARLRLLWFGHPVNFDSLQTMIPHLFPLTEQITVELHVVTAAVGNIEQACSTFNQQHGQRLKLVFSAWSLETLWRALEASDMVVIPSLQNDRKWVKSPNRLIESLWAGRFVIAHPLPSYQAFSAWAWLGWDLTAGIQWALQNPQQVVERLQASQRHIHQFFSPAYIAQQWARAFMSDRPMGNS